MKKVQKKKKPVTPAPTVAISKEIPGDMKWKWLIIAAAIISFGLSVFNDYVLDDFIVIVKNNFTQRGFSGIWDILSKDTFSGMTETNIMVLSGGRYRPLSLVTFAIENQFLGNNAFITHLINLAIYAFSGLLLFSWLKKLLAFQATADRVLINTKAALITLLFITMPAHSEPVINIKGRDDLMCLMFFLLSAIQLLKYSRTNKKINFFYSILFFFLSLMSKETALTFVLIYPLTLHFFTNDSTKRKTTNTAFYACIALVFLFFRYLATKDNSGIPSNDVLNNPFVHASAGERFATILLTWFYYLKLMVFPLHLSYDYNFNQIPVTNFSSPLVIVSILIHALLIYLAIKLFKRKSIYSFSILFYLITFSILSNLFFNIGAIFADRFIYIPSIGFCIAVIAGFFDLHNRFFKEKIYQKIGMVTFVTILIIFSARNISRCSDWKNNNTLFIADTDDTPNSAKVQLNAAIAYLSLEQEKDSTQSDSLIHKAIYHLQKGIDIYPTFIDGYLNMGVAYHRAGNIEKTEYWWNQAKKINPQHSSLKDYNKLISTHYFKIGLEKGVEQKFRESISYMLKALEYDTTNADIYYNIGGAYFTIQKTDSAKYYFTKTLSINPSFDGAIQGLRVLQMQETRR